MEDIAEFMETNQIEIKFASSDSNPFMPGYSDDMNHWFCSLTASSIETFDFYYSTTKDIEPEDTMALERLIEDVEKYKECDGYEDFLALFNTDDGEGNSDLAVAWAELERLEPLVTQLMQNRLSVQVTQTI